MVELQQSRTALLIHRLDREARGLMLVAHDNDAAAQLSALFASRHVEKNYQVQVRGLLPEQGRIEAELDGKNAVTTYQRRGVDQNGDSLVSVKIETGRKHQIRRHLELIGHPVLGDPQYGRNNSDERGLQLVAVRLAFDCPLRDHRREILLPAEYALFAV